MMFLTALALAAAALVALPYVAHRLRRRRAEEQPFPPARLVDPSPPRARRRSYLEDRSLFVVRSIAIAALAVLGATPLVRCSRLSLQRSAGASVALAIVLDDSMSMRAPAEPGATRAGDPDGSRFERARRGARELLASAREGDAVALVLAGVPARAALAPTTDLSSARRAIDEAPASDRATDLDGALALAQSLIAHLPQVDHRVVLLSDLADGTPGAPPLGAAAVGPGAAPVWNAMPELRSRGQDCAVTRADRSGARVRVQVACGPGASAQGRAIVAEDEGGRPLGQSSVPAGANPEIVLLLPSDDARPVRVRLTGDDAIRADDVAPVVTEAGRRGIAVVADPSDEAVATGGAPIVEQALAALKLDLDLRPLPTVPDSADELAPMLGLVIDDPPGLTPEQRRAVSAYLDGGGLVMLALGPRAAAAPLGASLAPILARSVGWVETRSPGADPASAAPWLAESAPSLSDLNAGRRAALEADDAASLDPLVAWTDHAVLLGKRALGRGVAWVLTLPLSVDTSDLALRPGFLAILEAWAHEARERAAVRRSEVGSAWIFAGARAVEVTGPAGPVAVVRGDDGPRVVPSLLGEYRIRADGKPEGRVVAPAMRELDLRPREAGAGADDNGLGQRTAPVDISGQVALVLLGLTALEMALRVATGSRSS
ncbi:MAG: VWA domain-containing protein [Myxococcales bacterium]|nr:VWA domain-containing protein [Myxococcales bacterium]